MRKRSIWFVLFALLLGAVSVAAAASPDVKAPALAPFPAGSAAITEDILYFSDFEGDNGGLAATLDWEWGTYAWVGGGCYGSAHVPPPAAYSGTHMWGTVLNTCYNNLGNNANPCANANPNDDSILSLSLDLTDVVGDIELIWWQWYDLFGNWDWAEVRVNGDVLWQNCESHVAPTAWTQQAVDLSSYAGEAVTIEFHMMASTVVNYAGWYIDDLMVTGLVFPLDAWKEAPATAEYGDVISYTVTLSTPVLLPGMFMTDTLPAGVQYAGNLTATEGCPWYDEADNAVYWTYTPAQCAPPDGATLAMPEITWDVTVTAHCGDVIVNQALAGAPGYAQPFAAITEVGGEAAIAVSPAELEATLCPSTTVTRTLSLCNQGDCPLEWTASESPGDIPWLSAGPTAGTVPRAECQDVVVVFDATDLTPGSYEGDLLLVSNDPHTPLITVTAELTVPAAVSGLALSWSPSEPVADTAVEFAATVGGGTPPLTYTWAFGDGTTGSGVTVTHVYTAPGIYLVELMVENACSQAVVSDTLTVTGGEFLFYLPVVFRNY